MDRRDKFRKEAHELYLPVYNALCDALPSHWQPYCCRRTPEEQNRLFYLQTGVTKARGWESPHQYGCATDWTIFEGKEAEWPDKDDAIWQEYLDACQKVGAHILEFERPHNELWLNVSWKKVAEQYQTFGIDAAFAFIRNNRRG